MKTLSVFWFSLFLCLGSTFANFRSGKATTLRLNDGNEIPVLGLGTAVGGGDPNEVRDAVEVAITAGYRHLDTAALYKTEKQVGLGVKAKIRDGTIRREDVFITTKLLYNRHEREKVVPGLRESLENLGLDFIDLYLIHWPVSVDDQGNLTNIDFVETWKGMEEAQRLGLTRSIGVSNFNEAQLQKLLASSKVKPVVNQVEVNPNLIQKKLVTFCQERGIQVVAYSPLGSMVERRRKTTAPATPRLDDPALTAMGDKYKKNTVQIVLRYLLDRNLIPIPKSVTPARIQQNIDVFDFSLTPEEMESIDNFDAGFRIIDALSWKDSPYYPF